MICTLPVATNAKSVAVKVCVTAGLPTVREPVLTTRFWLRVPVASTAVVCAVNVIRISWFRPMLPPVCAVDQVRT